MGMANTTAIVARHVGVDTSTYAAGMADALTFGGQSDWFLPSKDELNEMFKNKSSAGGFASSYWSSSAHPNSTFSAWGQRFVSGRQFSDSTRFGYLYVRPVRAF